MIRKLKIKNFAIIEDVSLEFSPHLLIITGETGAGKSIILGALNLVLGQRADPKVLGTKSEKCIVEAEFLLENDELIPFFESNDLDYDRELIIRREILPQGKSRAFINDSPVTLDILQTLSAALLDIHLQFDTLDLYKVSYQLRMLDALAGNQVLLKNYGILFQTWSKENQELQTSKETLNQLKQEQDFIQFQYNELDQLNIQPNELERLEEEQKTLLHAGEIASAGERLNQALTESEDSLTGKLFELERLSHSASIVHHGIHKIVERLQSVRVELEDISADSKQISEEIEISPARIAAAEERLNSIYRLLHKHKLNTSQNLTDLFEALQNKLQSTADLEENIVKSELSVLIKEKELRNLADKLHQSRAEVIPDFIRQIHDLLSHLSMDQAQTKIVLNTSENLLISGTDEVQFLLATNKGSGFLPIKNIASGGELARYNLVTKSIVAKAIPLPTLVFDEIDTGISGDIALKMGKILKNLSVHHQVICITHSPQVAARADAHYFVFKSEQENRTLAEVKLLSKAERIQAIATMLSSNPPSPSAVKNAKELIEIE